jgi:membrane peptidoglycan carboxypeptidase
LPPRRTSSSAGRATTSAGRPASTRAAAGTRGTPAPKTTRPRTSYGRGTTNGRGPAKGRGPAGKRRFIDYPRQGYTGFHRWLPSWRFVLGSMLGVAFVALGALFGMYWFLQVPSAAAQVSYQSSTVYFANKADGSTGAQMGQFAQMKRQIVPEGTIPKYMGDALVSMEDRTFYANSGVDLKGTLRALVNNLEGKPQQGASTLTQQYVKNYLVARTKTNYVGKLREAMLALKVSQTVPKDQILDRYLNTIYLGRDSYGVQAAAQSYFHVDAKDLTVSQAAMLIGIVPSPNSWDPATAPEKAQARWNLVLDAMVQQGYLDQATRATLKFPETIPYSPGNTFSGPNGYLLQMVVDELQANMGLSYDDIKRGGYTIVTTIDQSVQQDAVDSVSRLTQGALSNGQAPSPLLRVGVTSIDPSNGAIVALYGGPDYLKDSRNTVTYEKIQAGSTFKPYTLIAALEKGIGLKTTFDGHSPQTIPGWDGGKPGTVTNFDNEQPGTAVDLIKATQDSINTVYAQLNMQVGADKSADVAKKAGVTIPQPAVASNVLGVGDVHVLDQASGYATIAAGGVYNKPHIVAKVLNPGDNSVAFTGSSTPKRVFQADVIADTTYAMQQVVQHGTGATYIKPLGVPIAGKTGTSTDNKSAWFVGFTPKIVTAVALFQNGADGSSIDSITPFGNKSQVTGGSWPAKLWADYMKPVLAMPAWQATTPFPQPAWIGGGPTPTATPTATPTDTPTPTPTDTASAPSQITVPNIQGQTEDAAQAALTAVGLQPQVTHEQSATVGAGRVIRVTPAPGTLVDPGSAVTIVVSSGPSPTATPTPTPTATTTPTSKPTP